MDPSLLYPIDTLKPYRSLPDPLGPSLSPLSPIDPDSIDLSLPMSVLIPQTLQTTLFPPGPCRFLPPTHTPYSSLLSPNPAPTDSPRPHGSHHPLPLQALKISPGSYIHTHPPQDPLWIPASPQAWTVNSKTPPHLDCPQTPQEYRLGTPKPHRTPKPSPPLHLCVPPAPPSHARPAGAELSGHHPGGAGLALGGLAGGPPKLPWGGGGAYGAVGGYGVGEVPMGWGVENLWGWGHGC